MAVTQPQRYGGVQQALKSVGTLQPGALWPGFDPASIPVAIFDGEQTTLARFPALPSGFVSVQGDAGYGVRLGRHPAIMANTVTEIEGTVAAAILLDRTDPLPPHALTALIVHEAFHVFQRARLPNWEANEADLFMYPWDNPRLLALERFEATALQRSLLAPDIDAVRGWASRAFQMRSERYAELPDSARIYERETERFEGLASYAEWQLLTKSVRDIFHADAFAAGHIRRRCYATGLAWALLLDRIQPDWKQELGAMSAPYLDELVEPVVAAMRESAPDFSDEECVKGMEQADQDVTSEATNRITRRDAFLTMPGWSVELTTSSACPLHLRGFDPMNCERITVDQVLHTRYLSLGNEMGEIEMMDGAALTTASGPHPLFDGVSGVSIRGLSSPPSTEYSTDRVRIVGHTLTVEVPAARFGMEDKALTVHLDGFA